jgi:hypothetical protein
MPLGPLLVVLGYAVMLQANTTIADAMLWVLLIWPTTVLLLFATAASVFQLDAARWFSLAAGAILGTVSVAVVVIGGISAIAWMISDPIRQ